MNTSNVPGGTEKFYGLGSEAAETYFRPPITFQAPTVREEWERVKNYYTNSEFYDGQDYMRKIPLPYQDPFPYYASKLMGWPKQKLTDDDIEKLEQAFYHKVFDGASYTSGIEILHQCIPLLETEVFPVMSKHQTELGFYMPPHGYSVTLSNFGTNGSYLTQGIDDYLQSEISVLFTGVENIQILMERLIHEISHVGFSQRLIHPGEFRHSEKESFIDGYVTAHFGYILPGYERQGSEMIMREKLVAKLHDMLYICKLLGIDLTDTPDGDAHRVKELFLENSEQYFYQIQGRQGNHRSDNLDRNKVMHEHQWRRTRDW